MSTANEVKSQGQTQRCLANWWYKLGWV